MSKLTNFFRTIFSKPTTIEAPQNSEHEIPSVPSTFNFRSQNKWGMQIGKECVRIVGGRREPMLFMGQWITEEDINALKQNMINYKKPESLVKQLQEWHNQ